MMANYPNYYPQQLPWTQQNWYGQQVQQMQQPQQLTGRMVTSREEALGVPAHATRAIPCKTGMSGEADGRLPH